MVQSPAEQKQKTISVYLHTHWDREWYFPFETFRIHLARVIEKILLEISEGRLPSFVLDGQASLLEDVLELKPQLKDVLAEQMRSDKIEAGPSYVLNDQMLVGGESLIRNIAIGISTLQMLGKPAMVGYNPDTFCHSADLPRILRGFGIDSAIVWRGVPGNISDPIFRWRSADDSEVICYHLRRGYYNALLHQQVNGAKLFNFFENSCQNEDDNLASCWSPKADTALIPIGGDHMHAPVGLVSALNELNSSEDGFDWFRAAKVETLSTFCKRLVEKADQVDLETYQGELRDNSKAFKYQRAFVLPGVLSTRIYLKQDNREAERRLTRLIEPMASVLSVLGKCEYPQQELLHAWKLLLKNQPHDSICGTSVDAVHREMRSRTERFHHILNGVESVLLETFNRNDHLLASVPALENNLWYAEPNKFSGKFMLANTSASTLRAPVPVAIARTLTADHKTTYAGALKENHRNGNDTVIDTSTLQLANRYQIVDRRPVTALYAGEGKEPSVYDVELEIGYLYTDEMPPAGIKTIDLNEHESILESPCRVTTDGGDVILENDSMTVTIGEDGTFRTSAKGEPGHVPDAVFQFQLWDEGVAGDSYTFDPVPGDEGLQATLENVTMGMQGPLITSAYLTHRVTIPASIDFTDKEIAPNLKEAVRSNQGYEHLITTEVSLKRGVPLLFFQTLWHNMSQDHRVDVRFNLKEKIRATFSENHFSIIRRDDGVRTEGPLPVEIGTESKPVRFPCQRFFTANDHAFFNAGLPEYGFWDDTVAITILRAVSKLSRPRLATRGSGAGPGLPIPEANGIGFNSVKYAWAPLSFCGLAPTASEGSEHSPMHPLLAARCYELADHFEAPLIAWPLCQKTEEIPAQSLLYSSNGAIHTTTLFREGNWLKFRLLNVTQRKQETILTVNFPFSKALETNLKGDKRSEPSGYRLDDKESAFGNPCFFRLEFGPNELLSFAFKV